MVKGCHIHVDAVELAVRPAHSPTYLDGFVFKKVFRSTLRNDMASLKKFLQTGELGPIRPGMSQSDVIALLGSPSDESVSKHPQILKYGGLQLTFLNRPGAKERWLAHIGLYFRPRAEPIPELATPADFKGGLDTTIADVREFFAQVGLKESTLENGEDTSYLILPSGARITFDDGKLHSIIFSIPTAATPKKQVSVSIAKDTWNQLRTLAGQSNRSVADLCAEWITQRANEIQLETDEKDKVKQTTSAIAGHDGE